jgi:hypothetical protein
LFVIAHDDPGVRAAYEGASVARFWYPAHDALLAIRERTSPESASPQTRTSIRDVYFDKPVHSRAEIDGAGFVEEWS